MKKIILLIDYDDFWKGTIIEVERECDEYYYGIISERCCSYQGKLKKKYCIELPECFESRNFIDKYSWIEDQVKLRKKKLNIIT